MATLSSTGRFAAGDSCADNDILYGPYATVAAAHAALLNAEQNVIGRTVGIQTGNTIEEYWYQGGTEQANLVKKQSSEVEANPTGEATTPLNKIKIGETNYNIPQTDTSNLATKQELQQGLSGKQDTIADLEQIRTRADEGHTALQPSATIGLLKNDGTVDTQTAGRAESALQPLSGAQENNFASFDANGGIKDSNCNEGTFIKGVQQNGVDLQKDANGKVNVTVQDGEDGASAYEIWLEENDYQAADHPVDEFLASLKAQFGSFVPADYGTDGKPASGGIDITASASTTNYIYLVDNAASSPTAKVMWITVVDETDPSNPTYSWQSIGEVQVNLNFANNGPAVNEVGIDNEPTAGSNNLVKSGGVAEDIYLQGNPQFESGTISSGVEIANSKRIRSEFIPVKYIKNISVNSSHSFAIVYYDENQIYQSTQSWYETISDTVVNGYIRILIKRTDEGDILPSEITGLVCLYKDFGYSPFDIKTKLIKLENISGSSVSTGEFFYNPTLKVIRYYNGVQNITIPFIDGAVYSCNGELYVWNGTDLVLCFNKDRILNYTTNNNIAFESGTLNAGIDLANSKRIRSVFIPIQKLISLSVDSSHSLIIVLYDKNKNYLSQTQQWTSSIENQDINGYIRILIKRNDETDIDSTETTGLDLKYIGISYNESDIKERLIKLASITGREVAKNTFRYNPSLNKLEYKMSNNSYIRIPFFDGAIYTYNDKLYIWNGTSLELVTKSGVPEGGTSGQVLTPDGWSSNYPSIQTVNNLLANYVSESELQQILQNYVETGDEIDTIAAGSVSMPTLSQAVKDYIESSGGGSIVNAPDDIDIENDSNHRLQLKGGGVCRFRVKSTAADNYTELTRCLAIGLPIQIEDVVDLANSDGSVRDITFNNDTLVFVGIGKIKNCHIIGSVYVQANKTKIFDNVYFHHWTVNGVSQGNGSSLYGMILANTNYDVYNRENKTLDTADVSVPVNPFNCSFTANKIGSFVAPVLEGGKYVYKEDGNVVITFDDDGSGNIKLPIRKDFLFLNDGSVAESTYNIKTKIASYTYVAASELTISRLYAPRKVMDGSINGNIYPEWWGAKSNSSYDSKEAFQNAMILGGNIELSSDYYISGGIRIFGNVKISGNKKKITLLANSTALSMFEVESITGTQDGIYIYDLTLDGNKSNQSLIQDGIYCDFRLGLVPFSSYSMNNTYWYCITVQNFTGSGICVAVPGTSHIYSSWLAYNNVDGITWDNEHFTLTNVTCWGNGRHGAYASGNHWRIIGGAYAHNLAGDNIYCDHAFQSQIIGCSCIDSGKFVAASGGAYAADPSATTGYSYVGIGNGTHNLVGGNGINMVSCTDMTLIGVRITNQNANGILIDGGARVTISDSQFSATNLTSNPSFKDIKGSACVSNSYYNGSFVVTNQDAPVYFGSNGGSQDWNNLLTTLPLIRQGEYKVADYYGASNRPSEAGTYLEGTITCKYGSSNTLYRTYIRLMDENGVIFTRYVNINVSTGAYTNDSGWKKIN